MTSTEVTFFSSGCGEAAYFSRSHLRAAALKSVPSWNLTPFRRVKVRDLKSGAIVQPVARRGVGLPCASVKSKVSITGLTYHRSFGAFPAQGTPRLDVVPMMTFRIPPFFGAVAAGELPGPAEVVGAGLAVVAAGVDDTTGTEVGAGLAVVAAGVDDTAGAGVG